MSLYQDSERHHDRPRAERVYEDPQDEKRRLEREAERRAGHTGSADKPRDEGGQPHPP